MSWGGGVLLRWFNSRVSAVQETAQGKEAARTVSRSGGPDTREHCATESGSGSCLPGCAGEIAMATEGGHCKGRRTGSSKLSAARDTRASATRGRIVGRRGPVDFHEARGWGGAPGQRGASKG